MSNVQNLFSQPSFPLPYPGQSFFGSGNIRIFSSSGTFVVPPSITRIRVRVWGAGGSGGIAVTSDKNKAATGGGGGGLAIKVIDTTPGTSYSVTVGTGGASVTGASVQAGNAGGTSSFGSVCSATGGGAGQASSSNSTTVSVSGASGGTATGGDFNYTGGGSGACSITAAASGTYHRAASSGGGSAASIFGNGYASGSITIAFPSPTTDTNAISGGAGVGGSSGNVILDTDNNFAATGGGGTFSGSNSIQTTNGYLSSIGGSGYLLPRPVNAFSPGNNVFYNYTAMPAEFFNSFGSNASQALNGTNITAGVNFIGSYPANAVNRFPGDILVGQAISPSLSTANARDYSSPGVGGTFVTAGGGIATVYKIAGPLGGGCGNGDSGNNGQKGGFASIAGGGGSCAGYNSTDSGSVSGAGGNGQVIVEW